MANNIFGTSKGDASAYIMFYIIIPVLITFISLRAFPSDIISGVYCYVTIFVSATNGIYDGANRWLHEQKCRKNAKISVIFVCNIFVMIYCLYIIFSVLIQNQMPPRCDILLIVYIGTCLVACWDFGSLWLKDVTLKKEIGGVSL